MYIGIRYISYIRIVNMYSYSYFKGIVISDILFSPIAHDITTRLIRLVNKQENK